MERLFLAFLPEPVPALHPVIACCPAQPCASFLPPAVSGLQAAFQVPSAATGIHFLSPQFSVLQFCEALRKVYFFLLPAYVAVQYPVQPPCFLTPVPCGGNQVPSPATLLILPHCLYWYPAAS